MSSQKKRRLDSSEEDVLTSSSSDYEEEEEEEEEESSIPSSEPVLESSEDEKLSTQPPPELQQIIGTLDFGVAAMYRDLNELGDEPGEWESFGLYVLKGYIPSVLLFISASLNWRIVDRIDEVSLIVQRERPQSVVFVRGTVPAIHSSTEGKEAPDGEWWHGQTYSMQKLIRQDHVNLQEVLKDAADADKIKYFVVASLVPLRLISLKRGFPENV